VQLRSYNHTDKKCKMVDTTIFLKHSTSKSGRRVSVSPGKLIYKCSPHPPLRGPPSPLGKAESDKPQFEALVEK
ncbi:MAG: hypothetical protein J6B24_12065, partial [Clostridia bacterium]|nr:hypothetical protein [Clostridia bacterium]